MFWGFYVWIRVGPYSKNFFSNLYFCYWILWISHNLTKTSIKDISLQVNFHASRTYSTNRTQPNTRANPERNPGSTPGFSRGPLRVRFQKFWDRSGCALGALGVSSGSARVNPAFASWDHFTHWCVKRTPL